MKQLLRALRRSYYYNKCKKGIASKKGEVLINAKCKFNGKLHLGANDNFNGTVIKGNGKVIIGDNFHSGQDVLMLTSFHNYMGTKIPYDETVITKDIVIGDNVWLGDRVIILGGVTVGEGAIIQAGSVVVSDIPKCVIAGGHPAKQFKCRDIEDYEDKKQKKLFF